MVMARPPVDPVPPHARQRLIRILHEAKQRLLRPRDLSAEPPRDPVFGAPGADLANPEQSVPERPATGPSGAERPLVAETDILEAIAADLPLPDVLHRIALAVDALIPDAVCSILLLDPDGVHLRHGAAPHLPDELNRTLDGQPIGPNAGSCGTAAFTGEPVVVTDIATDPRWENYRHLVDGLGFRACWSTPVLDMTGRVLATFALYERTPKAPDDGEIEMIASFAHLVGIAIDRDRQREELRASEERFRTIYRSVPVSIWEEDWSAIIATVDELRRQGVVDFRRHFADHPEIVAGMLASMRVLDVNDQTLRILSVADQAELERKLKAGTLSDDVIGGFGEQIAAMAEGAAIYESERRFRSAAGEPFQVLMRLAYPRPDSGSGLVLVSLMDITVLKQLESERASFAERLGTTLESMTDAFYLVDRDWRFVYLNAEAERVLKRRRDSLIGRSIWREFPEAHGSAIEAMYVEAMRDGTPRHMEFFYPPLAEWFDVRAFPSAEGLAIYFRVITERKELDEKLRLSEERFREIANATTDVISDWDLATDAIWWGEGYTRIFGYPAPEGMTGPETWNAHIHPDDREATVASLNAAIARGERQWDGRYRFLHADGSALDIEDRVRILVNEDGTPVRMIGGMTDVTEHRRLAAQLAESEERFRAIARATSDIVWDWDLRSHRVWWANRTGQSGTYEGDAVDDNPEAWASDIHPDDRGRVVANLRNAIAARRERWTIAYRYRDGQGGWIDIEDHGRLIFDGAGKPARVVGGMANISERKQLEARLAESEERFRIIARATADYIWDWDLRTQKVWWADRVAEAAIYPGTGHEYQPDEWTEAIHPDDRDRVVATLVGAIERRDERWDVQYRYTDEKGGWIDIEDHGQLIFDADGVPVRMVGGMTDITLRKRLEAQLAESEERFRTIARATADLVWDWDLRTQKVWWADRQQDSTLFPLQDGELGAESWAGRIHPDDRDRVTASIRDAIERRVETWVDEYRFLGPDNREIHVEDHGRLIFDETGTPVRMVGGMTDITLRKRAEEALRQSEALAAIGERVGRMGGWALDLHSNEVYWSRGVATILEWTANATPTLEQALALYPEPDRERLVAALDECGRSGEPFALELVSDTKTGQRICVRVAAEAERDADGTIVRLIGAFQDITEKKRLDAQLRENEERFRLIADTAADRFWDWNLATGILWWAGRDGGAGEADIGTAIGPDLGDRIWGDTLHAEDRERVVTSFIDAIERGDRKWAAQYRYRSGDGTWIELEDRGQLIFDANGKLIRFMGSMTDITEKKRLDAQLRESEERFRVIARTTADVVWDWDLVAGTTWRSEGMYGHFGNPDGTSVSLEDWKARLHPDDRDRILNGLQETVDRGVGEWIDQYRFRDQRDQWIDIEDHGRIVLDESGKAVRFVGGMSDITARKRAERDLRERIKELACLYRAVELTTVDQRPVEAICADIAAILPGSLLHDDVAVARITVDGNEQRSAGWQVPLAALQAPIQVDGRALGYVEIGYTEERPDEGVNEGPFLREERALVNAVATHIGRMINDRRTAETLLQSEKLSSVGELTGGVAHDFNNLLTIILGNAEMLAQRLATHPELRPLAETTMAAAERGAELTSRLLSFARRQALDPVPTDINRLVVGMDGLLRRTLGEQIEMATRLGEQLRPSLVDAPRLENALLNLCINARDAMAEGGRLTIETRNIDIDADYAPLHNDVAPGRYVMIAVSDTGTGMTPEVLARAFDPFFTTKDVGKGSGLGLSMVYGFVKQSRGHVTVYSEPGQGSTVRLYLPEADSEAAIVPASEKVGMPGGNERILLVEDDDLVREHVAAQLVELGYDVTAVANGRAALERLRSEQTFDLLFTDIVMPGGINGRQLADAAHKILPELPVLFTSGYTEDAIVHHGRLDAGVHLLSKPYRRFELATKLREALGR